MASPPARTSPAREPRARVLVAGVAAALIVAIALLRWGGGWSDGLVFDAYQRLSPRDLGAMRVQIVAIDPESLRVVGPWPWSRYDMARLTEVIGRAGATAIGYDAFFPEADRQTPAKFAARYPELTGAARAAVLRLPSLDEAFAQVLGRYPTVLARAGVDEGSVDFGEPIYRDAARLPVEAAFSTPLPPGVAHWPQAISSLPAIEETAYGHGLVNGDPDADGVVRRVPAVGVLRGVANMGFAAELARVALGVATVRPIAAHGRLVALAIGDRRVPVAPDGRFRLRFGTVPAANITSAADVLRRGFDARTLRGKVVVISVTGVGGSDIVATPIAAQVDGVQVQAQAIDAILRRGWLIRPRFAAAAEIALGLLLAGVATLLLPRLRGGTAAAAAAALVLLVIAASWLAFARFGLLLGPVRPLLIGGMAGMAVLVTLFAEAERAQRGLRVSAARTAGELEAARDIQQGMLPPRASLAALDPGLDLDAILEPARSVGGDFFDAFSLPDGRIAFLVGDVTGKGVPAALFMALSKAMSRAMLLRAADGLAAALDALGMELSRDNGQAMFVTMLVGLVDTRTGAIELVNAGHENPLLVRADGSIETLAMDGGPPLCVVANYPYPVEPLTLAAGEGLIVVTDGVTEAMDAAGALFDRARLLDALAGLGADWRAERITAALVHAVRTFEAGAEPSDDLTALALRRIAPPSAA